MAGEVTRLWVVTVGFSAMLLGCTRGSGEGAPAPGVSTRLAGPPSAAVASASAASTPPPASASPASSVGAGVSRQSLGAWRVSVEVPDGASSEHEAAANRHSIRMAHDVIVTLHRVDLPAPKTLAEALKPWDSDPDTRKFGEGVTPNGAFYAIRSFEVRVGFPGLPGQTVHRLKRVSRVYAILPLDSRRRVECTGYVEHDIEGEGDPAIGAVRDICLSLRKEP